MSRSTPECRVMLDVSLKKGTQGEDDATETVSKRKKKTKTERRDKR
jgi:hypothetical protein